MANPLVITNGYFWLNGVDLSGNTRQITLNRSSAALDATVMGDSADRMKGGLKSWKLDVICQQVFACVDATIKPLVGTTACWEVRAINACSGSTNPSYNGIGTLTAYTPVSGKVGSILESNFSIVPFGLDMNAVSSCG